MTRRRSSGRQRPKRSSARWKASTGRRAVGRASSTPKRSRPTFASVGGPRTARPFASDATPARTDWIVDCLNDRQDALQTVRTLSREGVRTNIITYAELYQGAYYARDPAAALRFLAEFLQGIPILPLSVAVAERFAVVRGALSRQH